MEKSTARTMDNLYETSAAIEHTIQRLIPLTQHIYNLSPRQRSMFRQALKDALDDVREALSLAEKASKMSSPHERQPVDEHFSIGSCGEGGKADISGDSELAEVVANAEKKTMLGMKKKQESEAVAKKIAVHKHKLDMDDLASTISSAMITNGKNMSKRTHRIYTRMGPPSKVKSIFDVPGMNKSGSGSTRLSDVRPVDLSHKISKPAAKNFKKDESIPAILRVKSKKARNLMLFQARKKAVDEQRMMDEKEREMKERDMMQMGESDMMLMEEIVMMEMMGSSENAGLKF